MRTCLVALLLSLALVAAACGSKPKPKNAADWANAFCSNVATWQDSLVSAKNEFTANPSQDTLKTAANDLKKATDQLVSETRDLGKPPTSDGAEAQQQVQQLSTEVHETAQTVQTAVKSVNSASDALNAAAIINTNLQKLKGEAKTTFTQLQQLNPGGELETAFKQSSKCQSLGL